MDNEIRVPGAVKRAIRAALDDAAALTTEDPTQVSAETVAAGQGDASGVECPECEGTGQFTENLGTVLTPCPTCDGTGELPKSGEDDAPASGAGDHEAWEAARAVEYRWRDDLHAAMLETKAECEREPKTVWFYALWDRLFPGDWFENYEPANKPSRDSGRKIEPNPKETP